MTTIISDERIREIAANTVAADIDILVHDPVALGELLQDEDGVEDLPEGEHKALCDRFAAAIHQHSPDLAAVLAEIETNETVYESRYGLVLRAMTIAAAHGYQVGIGWDTDNADAARNGCQVVVYIELPTGQVSWHMPAHSVPWDGHSTAEKYRRCQSYAALRQ